MSSCKLDLSEELIERCGEIFLTIKNDLIFICSQCEIHLKDFQNFSEHIKEHGQRINFEEEDNTMLSDQWSCELNEDYLDDSQDSQDINEEETDLKFFIKSASQESLDEFAKNSNDTFDLFDENLKPETKNIQHSLKRNKCSLNSKEIVRDSIREFNNTKRLKLPHDSQERRYRCKICGFGFRDASNLASHSRRHFEKKFECPECKKLFYSRREVRIHIRVHTKERPFLCPDCGKKFVTSSALATHSKRHQNVRDFVCSICHKAFYDSFLLKDHMLSHNGEKKHKCDECDARFSRRKALISHLKLHENKREYKCEICLERFNQGPGLHSHLKSKHKLTKISLTNHKSFAELSS